MAKLKVSRVPTKEEMKALLEQRLPQYKYSFRGKLLVCAKSSFIGAIVVPRKDHIVINGNFPSMGATLLFVMLMIFTGILIGLLIWVAAWKSNQDKVRDEVEGVLKAAYALPEARAVA